MSEPTSPFSAPAVAAAATERALARLLRGRTWQATVREIAWQAVAAAEGDHALAVRLVPVADALLSELADGIECRVDAATVRAWTEHLEWRPHDAEGAEVAATIAAAEESERLVLDAYDETLRRTEETAFARRQVESEKAPRLRRILRGGRRSAKTPVPSIDLGNLGRQPEQYGWPRRDAA